MEGAAMPPAMAEAVGEPETARDRLVIARTIEARVVIAVIGGAISVDAAITGVIIEETRAVAAAAIARPVSITHARHADADADMHARIRGRGRQGCGAQNRAGHQ